MKQELYTLIFFKILCWSFHWTMIYVLSILTRPRSACVPSAWPVLPPLAPNCPSKAFSYSQSSKNSSLSKCGAMKRILKKCVFLSQWKCLRSVNREDVWVPGQGWNSHPFHWGAKWYWCPFWMKPQQICPILHNWDSRSDFFQSWRDPSCTLCLILHGGWLLRTSLSCGYYAYREEAMSKGKSLCMTSILVS